MPTPKSYTTKDGTLTWRVRYRNTIGQGCSKTFVEEADAQWFADNIDARGVSFALRSLRDLENENRSAVDDSPALATVFGEYITWKADYVRSDRTVADYRTQFDDSISPTLGAEPIASITPTMVSNWVDAMVAGRIVSPHTKKRLSPKTIAGRHALLHAVMEYAADPRRAYVSANPCTGVTLPKRIKAAPKGLMPAEWQALHSNLTTIDQDAADLAAFLIGSGWRWGEASALTPEGVEDYGPDAPMYVTMMQVTRRGAKGTKAGTTSVVPEGKAQKSMRRIKLDAETAAIVRRRCVGKGTTDPVFDRGGKAWTYTPFQKIFTRAAAGLTRRPTPHWLRHTHVGWLAMSGTPLPELQARIGHASITTTIGTYGSMISDVSDDTLEKFAAMRSATPQPPRELD